MELFDVYPLFNVTPVKGRDVYVYDADGTEYLDLYGGHAVISIGHSHPVYVKALQDQVAEIGFYSNSIQNPLQKKLAQKLGALSGCDEYQLFLCNSGAEANENALKLASFHTKRTKLIAFNNSFHGRTSAAVAATDNAKIIAPINAQQEVEFIDLGDLDGLEKALAPTDVCAVIVECIQGVGGLDEASSHFYQAAYNLCQKYGTLFIADEVQSGYGRTGDFFAFQKHGVQPDLISIAKGMGNGFPIGGVLIHPKIAPSYGLLGTTFGGNHLACRAALSVLEVIEDEHLLANAQAIYTFFKREVSNLKTELTLKGRGLMLGLEFEFPIAELRKQLLVDHHIFTGSSKNPNVLRLLPALSVKEQHMKQFFTALSEVLTTTKVI